MPVIDKQNKPQVAAEAKQEVKTSLPPVTDKEAIVAARELHSAMKGGAWGIGTDEDKITRVAAALNQADFKKVKAVYKDLTRGRDLSKDLKKELTSKELAEVKKQLTKRDGSKIDKAKAPNKYVSLNDSQAAKVLIKATKGYGGSSEVIKQVLAERSADSIKRISKLVERQTGQSLKKLIKSNFSGREEFDLVQACKGKPKNVREEIKRIVEAHSFERDGFSSGAMNAVSGKGRSYDKAIKRLETQLDSSLKKGNLAAKDIKRLKTLASYANYERNNYIEAQDTVAETAATVAATAAAAGLTVATAGMGTAVIAAAAATGGAGGYVAGKAAVQGDAYDKYGAIKDATVGSVEGVVTAASAGVGKVVSKGVQQVGSKILAKAGSEALEATAKTTAGKVAGKGAVVAAEGAADGFLGGAAGGGVRAATSKDTWNNGVAEGLKGVANAAVQEAVFGALGGSAGTVGMAGAGRTIKGVRDVVRKTNVDDAVQDSAQSAKKSTKVSQDIDNSVRQSKPLEGASSGTTVESTRATFSNGQPLPEGAVPISSSRPDQLRTQSVSPNQVAPEPAVAVKAKVEPKQPKTSTAEPDVSAKVAPSAEQAIDKSARVEPTKPVSRGADYDYGSEDLSIAADKIKSLNDKGVSESFDQLVSELEKMGNPAKDGIGGRSTRDAVGDEIGFAIGPFGDATTLDYAVKHVLDKKSVGVEIPNAEQLVTRLEDLKSNLERVIPPKASVSKSAPEPAVTVKAEVKPTQPVPKAAKYFDSEALEVAANRVESLGDKGLTESFDKLTGELGRIGDANISLNASNNIGLYIQGAVIYENATNSNQLIKQIRRLERKGSFPNANQVIKRVKDLQSNLEQVIEPSKPRVEPNQTVRPINAKVEPTQPAVQKTEPNLGQVVDRAKAPKSTPAQVNKSSNRKSRNAGSNISAKDRKTVGEVTLKLDKEVLGDKDVADNIRRNMGWFLPKDTQLVRGMNNANLENSFNDLIAEIDNIPSLEGTNDALNSVHRLLLDSVSGDPDALNGFVQSIDGINKAFNPRRIRNDDQLIAKAEILYAEMETVPLEVRSNLKKSKNKPIDDPSATAKNAKGDSAQPDGTGRADIKPEKSLSRAVDYDYKSVTLSDAASQVGRLNDKGVSESFERLVDGLDKIGDSVKDSANGWTTRDLVGVDVASAVKTGDSGLLDNAISLVQGRKSSGIELQNVEQLVNQLEDLKSNLERVMPPKTSVSKSAPEPSLAAKAEVEPSQPVSKGKDHKDIITEEQRSGIRSTPVEPIVVRDTWQEQVDAIPKSDNAYLARSQELDSVTFYHGSSKYFDAPDPKFFKEGYAHSNHGFGFNASQYQHEVQGQLSVRDGVGILYSFKLTKPQLDESFIVSNKAIGKTKYNKLVSALKDIPNTEQAINKLSPDADGSSALKIINEAIDSNTKEGAGHLKNYGIDGSWNKSTEVLVVFNPEKMPKLKIHHVNADIPEAIAAQNAQKVAELKQLVKSSSPEVQKAFKAYTESVGFDIHKAKTLDDLPDGNEIYRYFGGDDYIYQSRQLEFTAEMIDKLDDNGVSESFNRLLNELDNMGKPANDGIRSNSTRDMVGYEIASAIAPHRDATSLDWAVEYIRNRSKDGVEIPNVEQLVSRLEDLQSNLERALPTKTPVSKSVP